MHCYEQDTSWAQICCKIWGEGDIIGISQVTTTTTTTTTTATTDQTFTKVLLHESDTDQ